MCLNLKSKDFKNKLRLIFPHQKRALLKYFKKDPKIHKFCSDCSYSRQMEAHTMKEKHMVSSVTDRVVRCSSILLPEFTAVENSLMQP